MESNIQHSISKLNKIAGWHTFAILLIGGGIVFTIFLPLGYLVNSAFTESSEFIISSVAWSRIWFSLWQSSATVVLSLLIGGGLAIAEHTYKEKFSRWFLLIMTLPIFLPGVIVAVGFIAIWGNAGYVNETLQSFGWQPIKFLYSPAAIIAGHCFYNIPLAYIAIRLRLLSVHHNLEDSAQVLGANWWKIFTTIILPRLRSTIIGIGIIIFLYSFMSFALPLVLGGIEYQTLEVYIYNLASQQFNYSTAALLAIIQLISLGVITLLSLRYINDVQEKFIKHQKSNNFASNTTIFLFVRVVLSILIIAPLLATVFKGFNGNSIVTLAESSFISAWIRTFIISAVTISIATMAGLYIAISVPKKHQPKILLILAISPVTLSLAWRLLYGQSLFFMVTAYITLLLPLATYVVHNSWQARPVHFNETLSILGANKFQQLKSKARLLFPAIAQIIALGFAFVFGDIAVSGILTPYQHPTVMSLSYDLMGSYRFNIAATSMSLILGSILILVFLTFFISSRYDARSF